MKQSGDIRPRRLETRPPVTLSIAGTDPSGGAGIHADLKTFTAWKTLGTTAITALVAQNTHGVSEVRMVEPKFVRTQLDAVLDDLPVDASKSGMLGTRELVHTVVAAGRGGRFGFFVVDPVMVATSGHRLLETAAVQAVREELLPLADLITPNLPEAAWLLGDDHPLADTPGAMLDQARALLAMGPRAVLLKGGHGQGDVLTDVLVTRDGRVRHFSHPRLRTANTHGTGCTLSAAITAGVAHAVHRCGGRHPDDVVLEAIVGAALDYLARALRGAAHWTLSLQPEGAHGPVDHTVDLADPMRGIFHADQEAHA